MNHRNPAIKRILADVKELQKHPSSRYFAAPLENNMFEWHFTIRGPKDSAFEGGMYHGRILLPSEYPFKPPNIVFLTKNGRFEVGTKICLSISAYHEESWQPAWGVRTMLEAIISFLPSEGAGAIGALDWTKEERKKLAIESQKYCCSTCGAIDALLSDPSTDEPSDSKPDSAIADQIAQLHLSKAQEEVGTPIAKRNLAVVGANLSEGTDLMEEMSNAVDVSTDSVPHISDLAEQNDADPDGGDVECTLDPVTPGGGQEEGEGEEGDCGDSEVCTQLLDEMMVPSHVGTGELRHRVTHSSSETTSYEVPTPAPSVPVEEPVSHQPQATTAPPVTPVAATTAVQPPVAAVAPNQPAAAAAAPPRVAVAPAQVPAAPIRDAVDELLNTLIKLLIIAILCVVYKIANKHA